MALAVNESILRRMPFFLGSDPEFTMALSLQMRLQFFAQGEDLKANNVNLNNKPIIIISSQKGEEIIREGDPGDEMYFICNGSVEVLKENRRIAVLGDCQYFGEIALLQRGARQASVRTLKFTEMRSLERDIFLETLEMYPSVKHQMFSIANMRTKGIGGGRTSAKFDKVLQSFQSDSSGPNSKLTLLEVMQTVEGQGLVKSMSKSPSNAENGDNSSARFEAILKNVNATDRLNSPKSLSFTNSRKRCAHASLFVCESKQNYSRPPLLVYKCLCSEIKFCFMFRLSAV